VNTHNRLKFKKKKYFLTSCYVQVRACDFRCKMRNSNTLFSLFMQHFDGKARFLLLCHPLELYMILYSTGTVFPHCSIVS